MIVIGHRGACQEALENTWESFNKCLDMGCHRIELDLRLSKDKQVFVLHNPTTKKVSDKNWQITKKKSSELLELVLINHETLPRLEDLLKILPKIELNLELKGLDTNLAVLVGEALKETPLQEKIIVSSFNRRQLQRFKDTCPDVQTALLWAKGPKLTKNPILTCKQLAIKICHPEFYALSPSLMQTIRSAGLRVYPWISLKDEKKHPEKIWEKLVALKVDGFCTNYPREMMNWLKARGELDPCSETTPYPQAGNPTA